MSTDKEGAGEMIKLDLRLAGTVERYHTWPTIRHQTVAEHTWQVLRIYTQLFGAPDEDTFHYIMFHDVGEIITGDPPYPVKRDNLDLGRAFKRVEDESKDQLAAHWGVDIPLECDWPHHFKIAELIEMAEEGMVETTLGSRFGWTVAVRTLNAAYSLLPKFPQHQERSIRAYVIRRFGFYTQHQLLDPTAKVLLEQWSKPVER